MHTIPWKYGDKNSGDYAAFGVLHNNSVWLCRHLGGGVVKCEVESIEDVRDMLLYLSGTCGFIPVV